MERDSYSCGATERWQPASLQNTGSPWQKLENSKNFEELEAGTVCPDRPLGMRGNNEASEPRWKQAMSADDCAQVR